MSDAKTESATPRQMNRHLRGVVGHLIKVIVACAILMWSVFNIGINLMEYRATPEGSGKAWDISIWILLVMCALPFCWGVWYLFRSLGNAQPNSK